MDSALMFRNLMFPTKKARDAGKTWDDRQEKQAISFEEI
jgi:hypothetical protein